MVIKINRENLNLEKSLNVAELLMAVKATQLNGEFVERDDFPKIFVNDGDEVEFMYFMGGGQRD